MSGEQKPIPLTSRFADALTYSLRVHAGQPRKGTTIPYIAHPLAVASLALEHGAHEDEAIAALLHDVIEDSPDPDVVKKDIHQRFGAAVAAIVEGCSDSDSRPRPPWRDRKEEFIAHLPAASPSTHLVAASDKLHNARAILSDLREYGDKLWERFDQEKRDVLWYYRKLVEVFLQIGPPRLAAELERTVAEIERQADR
jgi:(p)ppGpp synthase/HD superfamily hydrolase